MKTETDEVYFTPASDICQNKELIIRVKSIKEGVKRKKADHIEINMQRLKKSLWDEIIPKKEENLDSESSNENEEGKNKKQI